MENRIQKIIDKQGIPLNAFAQEIGVNRSTVSHILTGRNKPSVEVLKKILKRFQNSLRLAFVGKWWYVCEKGAFRSKSLLKRLCQLRLSR